VTTTRPPHIVPTPRELKATRSDRTLQSGYNNEDPKAFPIDNHQLKAENNIEQAEGFSRSDN